MSPVQKCEIDEIQFYNKEHFLAEIPVYDGNSWKMDTIYTNRARLHNYYYTILQHAGVNLDYYEKCEYSDNDTLEMINSLDSIDVQKDSLFIAQCLDSLRANTFDYELYREPSCGTSTALGNFLFGVISMIFFVASIVLLIVTISIGSKNNKNQSLNWIPKNDK